MSISAKIVKDGKVVDIHTFQTNAPGEADLIIALGGDPDTDKFAHTLGTLAKKWEVLYLGSQPSKKLVIGIHPDDSAPVKARPDCTLTDAQAAKLVSSMEILMLEFGLSSM